MLFSISSLVTATTTIYVSPSSQTILNERNSNMNIFVEPDTSIAGMQFNLRFNNSIINVNDIKEGELFKQNGSNTLFNSGIINNETGIVAHVWGNILNTSGAPKNISTSGTFAIINITATDTTGISPIDLIEVYPISVLIANPEGNEVLSNTINGTLIVLRRGDVYEDNIIDLKDAAYIARYLAKLEPEIPNFILVGDVIGKNGNPAGDSVVDMKDAAYITRYKAGLENVP